VVSLKLWRLAPPGRKKREDFAIVLFVS